MKCFKCNKEIETTFLGKIKGTYIREGKKLKAICNECQNK